MSCIVVFMIVQGEDDLQQYYTFYMVIIHFDLISQYMLIQNKSVTDIEWFDVTWIIEAQLLESYSAVIENNVLCMYAGITVGVASDYCA